LTIPNEVTIPLDPFSEYAMAAENEYYPKTDFTQMQFQGKIDYQALAEAYAEALEVAPIFNCNLFEKWHGFGYRPYWLFNHEIPNRLQIVDCRHMVKEPFDPMEFSTDYYDARVRRRFDLAREFPFNCSLLQVGEDRYIFSMLYHHSALDPARAYLFLTRFLAVYHEKIKGEQPEWSQSLGMAALSRKNSHIKPIPWGQFMREQMLDIWYYNRSKNISHIKTESLRDYRTTQGRHSMRAVIDEPEIIKGLLDRAKLNEATFNDLIFAVARSVISEWNDEHNVTSERLRFMLITSLKGRMELPKDAGAGLSGLNFVSAGHNKKTDLDELVRFFRDTRKAQLANGIDIQFYLTACKFLSTVRLMPMKTRNKVMHPLSYSSPITFYLSNLGVVWPKFENGLPTTDSVVLGSGDFLLNDFHSSASIGRSVGLGLTIRTHNRRVYFNFVADRFRFRKQEFEEISDRIMKTLINAV
jgi:hypothetical protein